PGWLLSINNMSGHSLSTMDFTSSTELLGSTVYPTRSSSIRRTCSIELSSHKQRIALRRIGMYPPGLMAASIAFLVANMNCAFRRSVLMDTWSVVQGLFQNQHIRKQTGYAGIGGIR